MSEPKLAPRRLIISPNLQLERATDKFVKVIAGDKLVANIPQDQWATVANFFKDICNPRYLL